MIELEGIELMFSDQKVKPIPVKEYREYIKERKKEANAKGCKQKWPLVVLFPSVNADVIAKCNEPLYSSVVPPNIIHGSFRKQLANWHFALPLNISGFAYTFVNPS